MMGFFRTGSGSKLIKETVSADTPEQTAAIPVVTDTVEEDVSASAMQQQRQRNGLKSTLVSNRNRRSTQLLVDSTQGNTTLG